MTTGLALIARHHALVPDGRGAPLQIPGVTGDTYRECIRRLTSFDEGPEILAPRPSYSVLHAPVAVKEGIPETGPLQVTLFCGRRARDASGKPKLNRRYVVEFDQDRWPEAQRIALRQSAAAWVKAQLDLGKAADVEVHLYFLGTQSPDGFRFLVSDWRLACFQTVLRQVYHG